MTYQQIGDDLGISRQRVQQLIAPPNHIRIRVVRTAQGKCEDCGVQVGHSGHVHHISNPEEDYNDIANLRLLCLSCHMRSHTYIKETIIEPVELPTCKCLRCGNTWVSRIEIPTTCSKCRSPYWNRPKRKLISPDVG